MPSFICPGISSGSRPPANARAAPESAFLRYKRISKGLKVDVVILSDISDIASEHKKIVSLLEDI